ncbi:MAG: hypothetical protein KatS3mg109_1065 [Pirellulaceae bacterium]|nr:MAG: hypothetical protein KatS3mg109_1065 [Pirellulaceae bacterium]
MRIMRAIVGPVYVLSMLLGSLWVLYHELHGYQLHDVVRQLRDIPAVSVWYAICLTALNYVILVGYDWLALGYIGRRVGLGKTALAAFLGYAMGNSFGTLLGGSSVRLRLYSSWGLSAVEIVRCISIQVVTFWVGLMALAAVVLSIAPVAIPPRLHLPFSDTRPLAVVLAVPAIGYVLLCVWRPQKVTIAGWRISVPPWHVAILQYLLAALDLIVSAAVLFVLLPVGFVGGYFYWLSVYLLSLIAALFSYVPGGLGVFEVAMLILVSPEQPDRMVTALVAYRFIYYVLPLLVAMFVLSGYEIADNWHVIRPLASTMARWSNVLAPRILAGTLVLAGIVLLFSGATPATRARMQLIRHFVPLPVVEISHMLGSISGVLMIILARAVQRRVETAYWCVVILLTAGISFSLLKGLDYEEAAVLTGLLMLFIPCRRHFYRKGALITDRFTPGWFAAIGLAVGCTIWLTLFAYKHVEYRNELWWRFAFQADVARSLRAAAGAAVFTLFFAFAYLLRAKPLPPQSPAPSDLDVVRQIVARSPYTYAHLALVGDKFILFNPSRTAFIMYGIKGRSWVAMGDPVGEPDDARDLVWEFRELCDSGGRWPVFYQVGPDNLALYIELGLSLLKIGEEARVRLDTFRLEGHRHKSLRRTCKYLTECGCSFQIVEPPLNDTLLVDLERVSDHWLAAKKTHEKGFSMGCFRRDYIRLTPVALVRHQDSIVAFANVWRGAEREELSVDLMRYEPQTLPGVMDFLFVHLMLWGKEQGYRWFNLGMAPLSGVERKRVAPLWNQLVSIAYRYGEPFYNFRGLRQYNCTF